MRKRVIEDEPFARPVHCPFTALLEKHAVIDQHEHQRWSPHAVNVCIDTGGHHPMVVLRDCPIAPTEKRIDWEPVKAEPLRREGVHRFSEVEGKPG